MCEVFREIQTGPETHPLSCRMDTGFLGGGGGVKQQAHGADQSYSAELRMGRSLDMSWGDLYLYI